MPKRISELELIQELLRLDSIVDSSPKAQDMTDIGKYGENTYLRRFGSWNNALQEAGIEVNKRMDIPREELISELQRLHTKYDEVPSASLMDDEGKFSEAVYSCRYGSWNESLKEAGIEPNFHQNITKDELREELFRLEKELDHVPRNEEVEKYGKYGKSTYERFFGSWNNALDDVGFRLNKLRNGNRRDEKYGSSWCVSLKRSILKRDQYRCQSCFVSENQLGQKPDIHHIKPAREWNTKEEHQEMNSSKNLISLCRSCHRRFQGKWRSSSPTDFSIKCREEISDGEIKEGLFDY